MPTINLYHQNCMEFMKNVPDKAYDLAIVDVPYGKTCNLDGGTGRQNGFREYWDKANGEDNWNTAPDITYFNELFRVSKNQVVWGANHLANYLPASSGWIFWDKGQRDFSFSDGELAYTSFNVKLRAIKIHRQELQVEKRIHPTQKPVKLYKYQLKHYAKQGDRILDTHGGSMSIAIACYDLGFDLDLCELDKDYFEAGKKRFDEHVAKYAPAHEIPVTKKGEIKLF